MSMHDEWTREEVERSVETRVRWEVRCVLGARDPDADDAVQDVLLKAWRARASYRGDGSLEAWAGRIARNHCIDILRRRRSRPTMGELSEELEASQPREGAWRRFRRRVEVCLDRIPNPALRTSFVVALRAGSTYAAQAEALGIPVKTHTSRLVSAARKVMSCLREHGYAWVPSLLERGTR